MSQSWSLGLSLKALRAAIIEPNGEVRWSLDVVAEAITELADAGMVVVGLDIWPDREGAPTEIPFLAYPGGHAAGDVQRARDFALAALPAVPDYGWDDPNILVTWIPST
jgi:hypothetical protein